MSGGAWDPLSIRIFRFFWIASIFSNLGTWIHEVGASWLMTELDSSPEMVAAVRVSMSIPMTLMAIPAGIIADRFDRRQLLIVTQCLMLGTAFTLALLCYNEWIRAWSLLALTFVTGAGLVLHILAWQSSIPELVPRSQLPRAVALGSISFNLARSIGPALGGMMIALVGTWATFAVNALSFAGVLVVLVGWRREPSPPKELVSIRDAVIEGATYIAGSQPMRHSLLRLAGFLLPASALWSLMPLFTRHRLGWDERGYGFLVTVLGMGAVAAASQLHRIQRACGMNLAVTIAKVVYAVALLGAVLTRNGVWVTACTFVMGGGWMMTLTTLNATTQLSLTNQLRARGMSAYYTTMAASMSVGAFLWGQVAGHFGIVLALAGSAFMLCAFAILGHPFSISVPAVDRENERGDERA